ncbi:alpha/beta hydrolase [Rhodococcus sp. BP-252]|uniref:Alpha/beta hydrolase n=1 Tax=Rhodococcoides kyotonense TaxID=398843 RepID=A0A177YCD9_9NOCA|nr:MULTISPECIES: alpha/beta hydrolase [Rhodococcus]MBY6413670.1 alpha/beta hydrolase [Rhodococcus sp. BP-320]MBY6418343.1 alpha/beta hydrolase [Rhodococcus sp. BP-321]MBY6422468.1 alpha/beta hydrolase [Rhodococcus sp. BP-324]MBY6428288.1 alpha/beta hydrolase [Rhodococcus sp. BP-323]MBY6433465.1 alpha/beta hydrolase [Rhodococcus sp. BP-322]
MATRGPVRQATGIDGTNIVYRVSGAPSGRPLVLLHGWAQSSACWGDSVLTELAATYRVIAVDLRGHGYSDAPTSGYDDSKIWAGDVDAVLTAEGITSDAVLLGWSYGGLVICDYLSVHGTDAVSGIVLVGAITSIGRGEKGGRVGTSMRAAIPDAMAEEPRVAIRALGSFGNALTGPVDGKGAQAQALFGLTLATPPRVRAALFDRAASNDELLRTLDVPALVLHGTEDTVVDVSAGRHAASLIPTVTESYWDGVDHGPFVADPERFLSDVSAFVDGL